LEGDVLVFKSLEEIGVYLARIVSIIHVVEVMFGGESACGRSDWGVELGVVSGRGSFAQSKKVAAVTNSGECPVGEEFVSDFVNGGVDGPVGVGVVPVITPKRLGEIVT